MARKLVRADASPRLKKAARDGIVMRSVVGGATQVEAARAVGVHPTTVANILTRSSLSDAMLDTLQAAGLTPARLAEKLAEKLDATRTIIIPDGEGGATVDHVEDNRTQMQALSLAYKLYDRLTGQPVDGVSATVEAERSKLRDATIEELQIIAVRKRTTTYHGGDA